MARHKSHFFIDINDSLLVNVFLKLVEEKFSIYQDLLYTILWCNLWVPPFLYNRHIPSLRCWQPDNSKLVHYLVLRLRVYFWYFYVTNIDVMDQMNSSYQAEFNFIHLLF